MDEEKTYHRLLSFATGFVDRFALALIRSPHPDLRLRWQERLGQELEREGITVFTIHGDELPPATVSLLDHLRGKIPTHGRWVLSLSDFESMMLPRRRPDRSTTESTGSNQPSFLERLNLERDALVQELPVPVLFWASPAALRQMAEIAPDFYDFRRFILDLPQPEELGRLVDMPRVALVRPTEVEGLAGAVVSRLEEEIAGLRQRQRDRRDGARLVGALRTLAADSGRKGTTAHAETQLQEALAEAKRFDLREEQAELELLASDLLGSREQLLKALEHLDGAVGLYRELAAERTLVHTKGLVEALNQKGLLLTRLARPDAARETYAEALTLARSQAAAEPGLYLPLLAEVHNNLALLLASIDQREQAKAHFQSAIDTYRHLPENRYRAALALALNNLANLLADLNQIDDALETHHEALTIRRRLFSDDPERFRSDLCQSLYNLALLHSEIGAYVEARQLFFEALENISKLPEGKLEPPGCTDHQTRALGYRVDLGAIEAALLRHPAINSAIAMIREDEPGERRLVAYFTSNQDIGVAELRAYLLARLPSYMVPVAFARLNDLPASPRPAANLLPPPARKRIGFFSRIIPVTETEEVLAAIFAEVLGREDVGVHESFFDLGGNSLQAVRVVFRIGQRFAIDLPIRYFFQAPTVASLARLIEREYHSFSFLETPYSQEPVVESYVAQKVAEYKIDD